MRELSMTPASHVCVLLLQVLREHIIPSQRIGELGIFNDIFS